MSPPELCRVRLHKSAFGFRLEKNDYEGYFKHEDFSKKALFRNALAL